MKNQIIINGQDQNPNRSGGAGRYAQQLYKKFTDSAIRHNQNFDFSLVGFAAFDDSLSSAEGIRKPTFDVFKRILKRSCPPVLLDNIYNLYSNIFLKPKSPIENERTDKLNNLFSELNVSNKIVFHELTNYRAHSAIGRLSLSSNFLLAVTFLDIQDILYPKYFNDETLKVRRLVYSFFKDRADLIFAISHFTKQTMVEHLGIDPVKIHVTHLAADDLVRHKPSQKDIGWVKSFGKYIIYPANIWKHKNHEFLFKVLGKRREEFLKGKVKLLLTGGFKKNDLDGLYRLSRKYNLNEIVQVLGFVTDTQLQTLISNAECLIFPSVFEGFGMPVLEAMTLGCPVVCSNAASLPEIAGNAALYFDPFCEDELISIVDRILNGFDKQSLIERGYENASRFSWNNTFHNTLKGYFQLLQ